MKTIQQIEKEIADFEAEHSKAKKDSECYISEDTHDIWEAAIKTMKKCVTEIVFRREMLKYLQSYPTETFVREQLNKLTTKKVLTLNGFEAFDKEKSNYPLEIKTLKEGKRRTWYNSKMGLTDINRHIKSLTYLLDAGVKSIGKNQPKSKREAA